MNIMISEIFSYKYRNIYSYAQLSSVNLINDNVTLFDDDI